MSDVIDHFGDPEGTPMSRVATRVAHALLPVAGALMLVDVGRAVAADLVPSWLSSVSGWALLVVWIVAMLHEGLARICVRCMQEVPEDAPVRAVRRRRMLRLHHRAQSWWWPIVWIVFVVSVSALRIAIYPDEPARLAGSGWWLFLAVDAGLLAMIYASWLHHRLRPWCPYCRRWDDGGSREPAPDPDVDGVKS